MTTRGNPNPTGFGLTSYSPGVISGLTFGGVGGVGGLATMSLEGANHRLSDYNSRQALRGVWLLLLPPVSNEGE